MKGKTEENCPRVLMLSGAKAQLEQLGNLCGLFIIKGLRKYIPSSLCQYILLH